MEIFSIATPLTQYKGFPLCSFYIRGVIVYNSNMKWAIITAPAHDNVAPRSVALGDLDISIVFRKIICGFIYVNFCLRLAKTKPIQLYSEESDLSFIEG